MHYTVIAHSCTVLKKGTVAHGSGGTSSAELHSSNPTIILVDFGTCIATTLDYYFTVVEDLHTLYWAENLTVYGQNRYTNQSPSAFERPCFPSIVRRLRERL